MTPAAAPGSPIRPRLTLFALTWPIFIELALHVLTGTVDTFMVSHVSDGAVAALGVSNHMLGLLMTLFNVVGTGAAVVIGQLLGARDERGVRHAATVALLANAVVGLVVSAVLALQAPTFLGWMGLPPAILPDGVTFLTLVGGGLAAVAVSLTLSAILRAHGYTRDGMWVTLGVNALNIVGNLVLVFGHFGLPALGVLGVAISTLVSRIVGMLVLFHLLHRRLGLRPRIAELRGHWRGHMANVLRIGAPSAGENLSWFAMFTVVTTFTAQLGATALAAQSYVMQAVGLMVIFSQSIGAGTEILIARQVGAGRREAAYRQLLHSLRLGVLAATALAAAMAVGGRAFVGAFSADPAVIALAASVLVWSLALEPGRAFNLVVINALRAAGDARFPLWVGLLSTWGIAAPLAWLFGLHFGWGLVGIWWALSIDEWVRGLAMLARWRSRAWVGKALVVPPLAAQPA